MLYNDVVNMVSGIAASLNVQFFHGRNYDTTLEFGDDFPQIHLFPFQQQNVNENILRTELLIAFWFVDGHENNMLQRQDIISDAWDLAANFESGLRQVSQVQVMSVTREPQYLQMMGVLSGVALRVVINTGVGCGEPFELCRPVEVDLNGEDFLNLIAGTEINVLLRDEDGNEVTPIDVDGAVITLQNSAGGDVVLERSDDSSLITLTAPQNYNLADLNIEVVDENDNVILSTNQLVYTEDEIDLQILADCNIIIGENTPIEVVESLPMTGTENTIYFLIQ